MKRVEAEDTEGRNSLAETALVLLVEGSFMEKWEHFSTVPVAIMSYDEIDSDVQVSGVYDGNRLVSIQADVYDGIIYDVERFNDVARSILATVEEFLELPPQANQFLEG
jgi:hypothetical protein